MIGPMSWLILSLMRPYVNASRCAGIRAGNGRMDKLLGHMSWQRPSSSSGGGCRCRGRRSTQTEGRSEGAREEGEKDEGG